MKLRISGSVIFQFLLNVRSFFIWVRHKFESPSPQFVKQRVIVRNCIPDSTWIETGTFLGATTRILAKHSPRVISIEPQKELYEYNSYKFRKDSNISVLNDTSEVALPHILPKLTGSINFWLDGHFSDGITFKGTNDTPIKFELGYIEEAQSNFNDIAIFVDDVRCFNPSNPVFAEYPPLDFLVEWANRNGFRWTIEQDIFIATWNSN